MPNLPKQYRAKRTPKLRFPQHVHPPTTRPRGKTTERGYGWRWQRFRLVFLAAHPLCVQCEQRGRTTAAEHVHHIDGLGPRGERGYDPDNLQALCAVCHNRISANQGKQR